MNEVFRPTENIRINRRNGYLKPSFSKIQYWTKQPVLYWTYCLGWNFRNIEKNRKFEYFQTYNETLLNNLSNQNLANAGGFDYALAIIMIIFLFIKQIFLHCFSLASL